MCSPIVYLYYCYCTFINLYVGFPFFYACSLYVHLLVLLCRTWTVKFFWEIGKVAIMFRDFI